MSRCPKCRIDLELHIDEEAQTHHGSQPTQAYYICPNCRDTFPVYSREDES